MLVAITLLFGCKQSLKEELPIYNPSDFNKQLVDKSLHDTGKDHTVADFDLINQNGKTVTQDDYQNKIYVTDFFFTRCETICPVMTGNMAKIQEAFLNKMTLCSCQFR